MNRTCPLSGAISAPHPNGDYGEYTDDFGVYRISGSLLDAKRPWSNAMIAKAQDVLKSKREAGENPPTLHGRDLY